MMTIELNRDVPPIMIPKVFNRTGYLSLFDKMPEIKLKKGEAIFSARNAHHYIYLVIKGMVKTYSFHEGKEMLNDYYLKGEMLNCELLLNGGREEVMAEAMTQMTAIRKMPVEIFKKAMQTDHSLFRDILKSVSTSLDRSQERLRRITLLNSRKRVIHFLYNHTKTAGRRVGYEYVVKPMITHKEVGTISGTSRQTATTVMNELRSLGIIHFNRSYLIVRDIEALGKMASGD